MKSLTTISSLFLSLLLPAYNADFIGTCNIEIDKYRINNGGQQLIPCSKVGCFYFLVYDWGLERRGKFKQLNWDSNFIVAGAMIGVLGFEGMRRQNARRLSFGWMWTWA